MTSCLRSTSAHTAPRGFGLWVCHQLPPGRACALPRPASASGAGRRAGAQALDLRIGGVARGLAQLRGLQREAHGGPLRLGRARVHIARVLRRRRIRLAARLAAHLSRSHRCRDPTRAACGRHTRALQCVVSDLQSMQAMHPMGHSKHVCRCDELQPMPLFMC